MGTEREGDETARGRNGKGTKRQGDEKAGDETTGDETARGRNDQLPANRYHSCSKLTNDTIKLIKRIVFCLL